MKTATAVLLLLLLGVSVGCSNSGHSDPARLETDDYKFLSRTLANRLRVAQVSTMEHDGSGIFSAQMIVQNTTSGTVEFEFRARFYDIANREVRTTFSQWKWASVPAGSSIAIDAVGPDDSVVRAKFELRDRTSEAAINPARED
ncbi:MAG: hypothetical protein Kow00107_02040 [Planctomycetota bacterium]